MTKTVSGLALPFHWTVILGGIIVALFTPGDPAAGQTTPAASVDRPNIIFLFADDQRVDTISAYGNQHIQTPNLDRLSREGMNFRRNYCGGSFSGAVCVASRAMLMTGRHWMRLPKDKTATQWGDATPLPALLSDRGGYRSFMIGKWHNGNAMLERSFQQGRSVYMGGMANHADFQVQDLSQGKLSAKRSAGGFSSKVFADEAVRFIENSKSKEPFFLYVAFMAPHDPRNPPEPYRERYYNDRPPLPKNFRPLHPFNNGPQAAAGRDESLAPWPRTESIISDQLCEYYGLVTHLDEQVGRILTALDQSPHAENTIVIYTADHGLAMGSHGLLGKQNIYEVSMQSPLIIRGPGIPQGKSTQALNYIHDLYATVCDLAKIEPPSDVDSRSLGPVLRGEQTQLRDSIFLPFQNHQRALVTTDWKLHVYPKVNHRLLFELQQDPDEMHDLATMADQKNRISDLLEQMEVWREELDDPLSLTTDSPEPLVPDYNNEKRTLDVWQPKWIRDKYFEGREPAKRRP